MKRTIQILSEETINQIAAGEVIENPASVIKELVENAVDAGATHVCVETLGGGFQQIRVSDNGSGMSQEEALLSLQRYATSKIVVSEDLFGLNTMGFRGEALASIAAISKMTMITSVDGNSSVQINVEGGEIKGIVPFPRVRGTTFEVRSLFYNVPVRKKFQKSGSSSSADITKVMTQLSLAHPHIGFELIQQKRPSFLVNAATRGAHFTELIDSRIKGLLGDDFHVNTFKLELKQGDCDLKGVIGSPLASRPNRLGQYLFVNKRPVVSPAIAFAIRNAYGTRLGSDRFPLYVLHLQLPPHLIDVNVHPQKKEIRLRDEILLKENIYMAVNLSLERAADYSRVSVAHSFPPAAPIRGLDQDRFNQWRMKEAPLFEEISIPLRYRGLHSLGVFAKYWIVDANSAVEQVPFLAKEKGSLGFLLIDLEAAQESVLLDSLLNHQKSPMRAQALLIPITFEVSIAEAILALEEKDLLKTLGVEVRLLGKNTLFVETLPSCIPISEGELFVKELLESLDSTEEKEDQQLRELSRITTHFARRDKKIFLVQEAQEIFNQLIATSSPFLCPRGKPTMIHMSQDEIQTRFSHKKQSP